MPAFEKMINLLRRGLCLGLVAAISGTAAISDAAAFDHQYLPPDLPENAVPAWAVLQKGGIVSTGEDGLTVETAADKRHFYGIGVYSDGKPWGDGSAWDASAGVATLDFRLKCASEEDEAVVFTLILRDGRQQWILDFRPHRINSTPAETGDWNTYRVTLENGLLQLSSTNGGVILRKVRGAPDERGNALLFGTYSYRPGGSGAPRQWSLQFLRWTNRETLTGSPPAE